MLLELRVWNKYENKMLYTAKEGWSMIADCFLDGSTDDNEIMHFTSLKDKNGQDIYEGDILTENITVVFCQGSFKTTFSGDQASGTILSEKRCKYLEIIGNIYEKQN